MARDRLSFLRDIELEDPDPLGLVWFILIPGAFIPDNLPISA